MKDRKKGEIMTPKQKLFCIEYIKTSNATESAKLAGYSKKTAHVIGLENLDKPIIKKYIAEKLGKIQDDSIASAEEVLKLLTEFARGKVEEETVVVVGTGEGRSSAKIINKQISPKDRIKATELLAKKWALLTDKIQSTETVPPNPAIESLLGSFVSRDIDGVEDD